MKSYIKGLITFAAISFVAINILVIAIAWEENQRTRYVNEKSFYE